VRTAPVVRNPVNGMMACAGFCNNAHTRPKWGVLSECSTPRYRKHATPSVPLDTHLLWCGDHAELLQHAHLINIRPMLHKFAIRASAGDVDFRPRCRLAGWEHAQKLPLHRAVSGEPLHDLIPFGDRVLHRVVQVGKRLTEQREVLLESRHAGWKAWWNRSMIHIVGNKERRGTVHLPSVNDLRNELIGAGRVLFGGGVRLCIYRV